MQHACQLPLKAAPGGVTSVHWAPNLSGGSQELLAIAYGRSVAVAALAPAAAGAPGDVGAAAADPVTPPLRAEVLAALDHGADVWRVEWNLTGNCVAAATDDARVCLWKADLVGAWRMHAVVQGEPEPVGMNDDGMAVA